MKRRFLMMMLAFGMCSICVAQMKKEFQVGEDGYEWYKTINGSKEGAQDRNGNTIVPCEYFIVRYEGSQYDWRPKVFEVRRPEGGSEEYYNGIYTTSGRCVIPTSRRYTFISGYIKDSGNYYTFEKKGIGCGICDENGREVVFIPRINSIIPGYEKGKFYYDIERNDLWGVADGNGKIVIEPKYSNPVSSDKAVAAVRTAKNPLKDSGSNTLAGGTSSGSHSSSSGTYSSSNSASGNTTVVVEHHRDLVPVQEWLQCPNCHGSGVCFNMNCRGEGYYYIGNNLFRCGMCMGSGRCSSCAGRGGKYVTVYK